MPRPPRYPYTWKLIERERAGGVVARYWRLDCRVGGKRYRPTLVDRALGAPLPPDAPQRDVMAAAHAAYAMVVASSGSADTGAVDPTNAAADPTLADLLTHDAARADASPATRLMAADAAKNLKRLLGADTRLSAITRPALDLYRDQRQREKSRTGGRISNRTINLETHNTLLAAWRRATESGRAPALPPWPRALPETRGLVRWLEPDELRALIDALRNPPPMTVHRPGWKKGDLPKSEGGKKARTLSKRGAAWAADSVVLLASTGIRRSNLMGHPRAGVKGFAWRDVQWERRLLRVASGKRGASGVVRWREVPLAPPAMEVLERRLKESGERRDSAAPAWPWLGRLAKWLVVGARLAKIHDAERLRVHDLRHTFATLALRGGASVVEVAQMLGDRPETVLATYIHASEGASRAAVDSILGPANGHRLGTASGTSDEEE